MRVLVLGAGGMLGHKLCQRLRGRFEVVGTVRGEPAAYAGYRALDGVELRGGVDAERVETVGQVLEAVRPDVAINAIGTVKQRAESKDPITAITVNALFPHQLARLCSGLGARVLHFSTDCVFAGSRGDYREDDVADATDLYGRTKLLGELAGPGCLTLRTSIIGRELGGAQGLIEWFLSQRGGRVRGYARARFSGLTTPVLADLVGDLLERNRDLEGLWHVSAEPISKLDLLEIVNRVYGTGVSIERDEALALDRSLDSSRFRARTGFRPPGWETMIADMHADEASYAR
jgi:dTDP-4-dehydrorhamnose reductase